MKNLLITLVSVFNKFYLRLFISTSDTLDGIFFRVKMDVKKKNSINISSSEVLKSWFLVNGSSNEIIVTNSHISNSSITISGENNRVVLSNEVKLRGAEIIIRGSNCVIEIGNRTTFGGIRIINVGSHNSIKIGEDCLFSDNIELWSSDTHPIYDEKGDLINIDKPVKIGSNVWVGSRVIILKGVNIGDGSIIGMGSVVTKDVPNRVVSAGYPNKTIRENVSWKLHY